MWLIALLIWIVCMAALVCSMYHTCKKYRPYIPKRCYLFRRGIIPASDCEQVHQLLHMVPEMRSITQHIRSACTDVYPLYMSPVLELLQWATMNLMHSGHVRSLMLLTWYHQKQEDENNEKREEEEEEEETNHIIPLSATHGCILFLQEASLYDTKRNTWQHIPPGTFLGWTRYLQMAPQWKSRSALVAWFSMNPIQLPYHQVQHYIQTCHRYRKTKPIPLSKSRRTRKQK
jgi:hypothetical protein